MHESEIVGLKIHNILVKIMLFMVNLACLCLATHHVYS